MRSKTFALLLACFCALADAQTYDLSGTVTDAAGHGIAGVWVGLAQAKLATLTASDGTWSLGTTGIRSKASYAKVAVASHLAVENGRLRFSFSGKDVAGRVAPRTSTAKASAHAATARKSDAVTDTILFGGNSRLFATHPVASSAETGIATVIDTATWVASVVASGDIFVWFDTIAYLYIECNTLTNSLELTRFASSKGDTFTYTATASGLELRTTVGNYADVLKFTRLDGTGGALVGTYVLSNHVYRPAAAATIPDSILGYIATDSAISQVQYSALAATYVFSATTTRLVGRNHPAPGRAYLTNWNSTYDAWWYYDESDSWEDDRAYSDSANYNIAAALVDSNTVKLYGNTTKETATVVGTLAQNGWGNDYTYSSSDASHAASTNYATPTTCPNGPSWLSTFKSGNKRSKTAARVLSGTASVPGRRPSFPF